MIKLTGIWKFTTKEGLTYYSGTINGSSRLLIFPNKKKTRSEQPDFEVYIAEPLSTGSAEDTGVEL